MICFSLVAHEDEKALFKLIKNIHHYTGKDNMIILYNGGTNEEFGKEVCQKYHNVKLCPYSRPLQYRKTGRVLYDMSRWLEESNVHYDYLVYLESDTMFIKHGFVAYLKEQMQEADFIGQHWSRYVPFIDPPKAPSVQMMMDDWERWQPFFQQDYFLKTSNPFQTYRQGIIREILKIIDGEKLESLLLTSPVESLGEMIFPTFAEKCGAKSCMYPKSFRTYNRWKPALSIEEIKEAMQLPEIMFVHPVKDDTVRDWIDTHYR